MALFFFSSLRGRLILLVLLAVVPAMALSGYGFLEARRQALRDAQAQALTLARSAAARQDSIIDEARVLLVTLAQVPQVQQRDPATCAAILANLHETFKRYIALNVVGLDGVPLAGAPPLTEPMSYADRDWYRRLLETRQFVVSEYLLGKRTKAPVLVFTYPVFNNLGELTGMVNAALDLEWLNGFILQTNIPPGATLTVLDRQGTILASHPDPGKLVGRTMPDLPIVKEILARGEGVAEVQGWDGVDRIFGFAKLGIQANEIFVAVGLPQEEALAPVRRDFLLHLAWLGLAAGLALAAAWFGGDLFIRRQVNDLLSITRRLEEGDLEARTGPPYPLGELGQLAQAFDRMSASLQVRDEGLQHALKMLRQAQQELEQRVAERTAELAEANVRLTKEIYERQAVDEELHRLEWLLLKKGKEEQKNQQPYEPVYGDLTAINTSRLLLNALGPEVLQDITSDYINLLDTSVAIYEKNGDYALGIFASSWCRLLDEASFKLCGVNDAREALASGKWLCHESCWTTASRVAIETGQPTDIECHGGIRLYAVPIWARGEVVGSLNFGYGDPPQDPRKLQEIAENYRLNLEDLQEQAQAYQSRPPFIIEIAKERLLTSSRLVGEIVERQQAETALRRSRRELTIRNRIANIFLTVADDAVMYEEVLQVVLEAADSRYGVFGYLDENGDLVVPSMTRHIWEQCQAPQKTLFFPRQSWGNSIWPRAIREKRTLFANEPSTLTPPGHIRIERNISCPIIYFGEVIGLFQVANKETDYTEADLREMEMIAHTVAPILSAQLQRDRQDKGRREAEAALALRAQELEQTIGELDARIREIKRLNEVLADANLNLAEASRVKDEFLANMSHELRTPLTSIIGFSEVLEDEIFGPLNDKQQNYIGQILSSGKHLLSLINDILDLAKVESGKVELEWSRFPLAPTLRSSLMMVKEKAGRHGISLDLEVAPDADLEIEADERRFKQIMFNLLSNAVKFTPDGGRVTVGARFCRGPASGGLGAEEAADFWKISVADTGIGVKPEDLPRLFKKFSQLEHTDTKTQEGTGLGLALTRRLVELHGGRIWVESQPRQGSTFYFTIPEAGEK